MVPIVEGQPVILCAQASQGAYLLQPTPSVISAECKPVNLVMTGIGFTR